MHRQSTPSHDKSKIKKRKSKSKRKRRKPKSKRKRGKPKSKIKKKKEKRKIKIFHVVNVDGVLNAIFFMVKIDVNHLER